MTAYDVQEWHTPPFETLELQGNGCRLVGSQIVDAEMYHGQGFETDGYYWRIDPSRTAAYYAKRRQDKALRKAAWRTREEQDSEFARLFPETVG